MSVAAVAAWRDDVGERFEVEFDDGLERLGGGGVGEGCPGKAVVPGAIFGLQGEQFGDGVTPALGSGAPVGWAGGSGSRAGAVRPRGGRGSGPAARRC